ncbi:unnamed protein product [Ostreobium quekettii]|uniref:cGMP-dependent protein kinase n=1 Tax=Ostreobium quekettii TaxID=121088 RepID=A0A8S1JA26_9CHLO|nr:unnamed protein product [Ostreobium quekettii]
MGCLYSKEGLSPTDNDPGASYAPPKPGALHGHPPALPGALETPKGGTRHGAHGPKPLPRPAQQPSADAHRRPRNSTSEGQRSSRQKSARPSHEPQRHISDTAEDGDWDNCETVFNLDDVEEAQIGVDPSQVDTQGSSVVDKAFQNSLLGSKSSAGLEDPPASNYRETPLLRIEKVKGCMFVNQYLVVKYLGRGACGKVFLCLNVQDSRLYAMKAVRKSDLQTSRNQAQKRNPMEDLKREIMIMKKMKHPNIVTLTEVIDDPSGSKLLLVMEYMEGGPVMTRESLERCERLPEELVARYFKDMVRALDYLHSQRVVHGDLKPENVLVSAHGEVKLSDFGCSKVIVSGNEYLERCNGTPAFLAPEMMKPNSRYRGRPTDIYAMGACLYTLVFGRIPFTAPNLYQLFQVVQNENVSFPENVHVSDSLKDLLNRLLTKNPKERITLLEVRHHPWVTGNGRYPLPRWTPHSDPYANAAQENNAHKVRDFVAKLAKQSVRERTFEESEILLRQGDTGSFMLYIINGKVEVLLKCSMPARRTGRSHSSNRKRGSTDSGDPLMNSSDSASSVALTEDDRQARQTLVSASSNAIKFIRTLDRSPFGLHVGTRSGGDVVGEMALFSREATRTATVRALTKTTVKVLSKEEVFNYFARHPKEKQQLREVMWKREGESVTVEGLFQLGKVHEVLANSWGMR